MTSILRQTTASCIEFITFIHNSIYNENSDVFKQRVEVLLVVLECFQHIFTVKSSINISNENDYIKGIWSKATENAKRNNNVTTFMSIIDQESLMKKIWGILLNLSLSDDAEEQGKIVEMTVKIMNEFGNIKKCWIDKSIINCSSNKMIGIDASCNKDKKSERQRMLEFLIQEWNRFESYREQKECFFIHSLLYSIFKMHSNGSNQFFDKIIANDKCHLFFQKYFEICAKYNSQAGIMMIFYLDKLGSNNNHNDKNKYDAILANGFDYNKESDTMSGVSMEAIETSDCQTMHHHHAFLELIRDTLDEILTLPSNNENEIKLKTKLLIEENCGLEALYNTYETLLMAAGKVIAKKKEEQRAEQEKKGKENKVTTQIEPDLKNSHGKDAAKLIITEKTERQREQEIDFFEKLNYFESFFHTRLEMVSAFTNNNSDMEKRRFKLCKHCARIPDFSDTCSGISFYNAASMINFRLVDSDPKQNELLLEIAYLQSQIENQLSILIGNLTGKDNQRQKLHVERLKGVVNTIYKKASQSIVEIETKMKNNTNYSKIESMTNDNKNNKNKNKNKYKSKNKNKNKNKHKSKNELQRQRSNKTTGNKNRNYNNIIYDILQPSFLSLCDINEHSLYCSNIVSRMRFVQRVQYIRASDSKMLQLYRNVHNFAMRFGLVHKIQSLIKMRKNCGEILVASKLACRGCAEWSDNECLKQLFINLCSDPNHPYYGRIRLIDVNRKLLKNDNDDASNQSSNRIGRQWTAISSSKAISFGGMEKNKNTYVLKNDIYQFNLKKNTIKKILLTSGISTMNPTPRYDHTTDIIHRHAIIVGGKFDEYSDYRFYGMNATNPSRLNARWNEMKHELQKTKYKKCDDKLSFTIDLKNRQWNIPENIGSPPDTYFKLVNHCSVVVNGSIYVCTMYGDYYKVNFDGSDMNTAKWAHFEQPSHMQVHRWDEDRVLFSVGFNASYCLKSKRIIVLNTNCYGKISVTVLNPNAINANSFFQDFVIIDDTPLSNMGGFRRMNNSLNMINQHWNAMYSWNRYYDSVILDNLQEASFPSVRCISIECSSDFGSLSLLSQKTKMDLENNGINIKSKTFKKHTNNVFLLVVSSLEPIAIGNKESNTITGKNERIKEKFFTLNLVLSECAQLRKMKGKRANYNQSVTMWTWNEGFKMCPFGKQPHSMPNINDDSNITPMRDLLLMRDNSKYRTNEIVTLYNDKRNKNSNNLVCVTLSDRAKFLDQMGNGFSQQQFVIRGRRHVQCKNYNGNKMAHLNSRKMTQQNKDARDNYDYCVSKVFRKIAENVGQALRLQLTSKAREASEMKNDEKSKSILRLERIHSLAMGSTAQRPGSNLYAPKYDWNPDTEGWDVTGPPPHLMQISSLNFVCGRHGMTSEIAIENSDVLLQVESKLNENLNYISATSELIARCTMGGMKYASESAKIAALAKAMDEYERSQLCTNESGTETKSDDSSNNNQDEMDIKQENKQEFEEKENEDKKAKEKRKIEILCCDNCGNKEIFDPSGDHVSCYKKCGNCLLKTYCSDICQGDHWENEHKYSCNMNDRAIGSVFNNRKIVLLDNKQNHIFTRKLQWMLNNPNTKLVDENDKNEHEIKLNNSCDKEILVNKIENLINERERAKKRRNKNEKKNKNKNKHKHKYTKSKSKSKTSGNHENKNKGQKLETLAEKNTLVLEDKSMLIPFIDDEKSMINDDANIDDSVLIGSVCADSVANDDNESSYNYIDSDESSDDLYSSSDDSTHTDSNTDSNSNNYSELTSTVTTDIAIESDLQLNDDNKDEEPTKNVVSSLNIGHKNDVSINININHDKKKEISKHKNHTCRIDENNFQHFYSRFRDTIKSGNFEMIKNEWIKRFGVMKFDQLQQYYLKIYIISKGKANMIDLLKNGENNVSSKDYPNANNCCVTMADSEMLLGYCAGVFADAIEKVSQGEFENAIKSFQSILCVLLLIVIESLDELKQLKNYVWSCAEYINALRCRIAARSDNIESLNRSYELRCYATHFQLKDKHIFQSLYAAIKFGETTKNYHTNAVLSRRLLNLSKKVNTSQSEKMINRAKKILESYEKMKQVESNSSTMDMQDNIEYNPSSFYKLCCMSFEPIGKDDEIVQSPYCGSMFKKQYNGQLSPVCKLVKIGANGSVVTFG